MIVSLKGGEPKTKTVDGATYHFCLNHVTKGAWVKHKLEKCRLNKKDDEKSKKDKKKDKTGSSFAHTFTAIMTDANRKELSSDSEVDQQYIMC
eukprot:12077014-Ditylum_brightwellii.AAC.1